MGESTASQPCDTSLTGFTFQPSLSRDAKVKRERAASQAFHVDTKKSSISSASRLYRLSTLRDAIEQQRRQAVVLYLLKFGTGSGVHRGRHRISLLRRPPFAHATIGIFDSKGHITKYNHSSASIHFESQLTLNVVLVTRLGHFRRMAFSDTQEWDPRAHQILARSASRSRRTVSRKISPLKSELTFSMLAHMPTRDDVN